MAFDAAPNPELLLQDPDVPDDGSTKLAIEHALLGKFMSPSGTVNIQGAAPLRVDDPIVLACFEGNEYRPHYRAMRFARSFTTEFVLGDGMLNTISNVYRNQPLIRMPGIHTDQKHVLEYTGVVFVPGESSTTVGTYVPLPSYTNTCFIPGRYKTEQGPICHQGIMCYVYSLLPPTFRSTYQIDEETKFTWFIGDRTLSVMMDELHEILAPRLNSNSELVCRVLSFIPCDAEVLELLIIDASRTRCDPKAKVWCLWSYPNQFDQIQCLKDDDINGNKWVRCPLFTFPSAPPPSEYAEMENVFDDE